jgi:S-adenosylmethionine synthetase
LSLNIDTFGTGTLSDVQIQRVLEEGGVFDFRPAAIIRNLGLKHPFDNGWSFRETAAYGHFGRDMFPWEKTDKAEALRQAAERLA